jgi:phosphatidylserine decarboxylase
MLLTRYGMREWLVATVIAALAVGLLAWAGWWWGLVPVVLAWMAVLWFFRDPRRRVPADLEPGALLSPADGRVTAVERVESHPAVGGPALVVRIFLSVLNVHVNRAPADGEVSGIEHRPGGYRDARDPRSAAENESNLVVLRSSRGPLAVRQIAGKIARRIVCDLATGTRLARGQRFGMIKFGSSTELIVPEPEDARVHVRVGDRVRGGLTVLVTVG